MNNEYDHITSYHYSKYRPPLHALILKKCLKDRKMYNLGLDIGCGTGKSSLALKDYCNKVIGIDPSPEMIANSIKLPNVDYQLFDGKKLSFKNESFDIITYAGALYYAKSQEILDETIRVCKNKAQIIIYDFEVHLEDTFQYLNLKLLPSSENSYNHQESFTGLDMSFLHETFSSEEDIIFDISPIELTHLLLSSKTSYKAFQQQFSFANLEDKINSTLSNPDFKFNNKIKASIFYTIYEVKK